MLATVPVGAADTEKEPSSDELSSSENHLQEDDGNDDDAKRPVWERKPDESLKFHEDMTNFLEFSRGNWVRTKQDKPLMTNIQFRHARMIQLVNNAEWKRAQQNSDSTFVDKSIPGPPVCKLKHYDKGRGEWDIEANDYKFPAQKYQKYFCKWTKKCKNKVRTYCACKPQITLCIECYPGLVGTQTNHSCICLLFFLK